MRYSRYAFPLWLVLAALDCGGQTNPGLQAFTCVANAGTPVIVRVEGITELVGDLLLQCTGGNPTPAGQQIPVSNIKFTLNTNITSRLLPGGYTDALLLIDDPYPPSGTQIPSTVVPPPDSPPQKICLNLNGCPALGVPLGQSPYIANQDVKTIYVASQAAANQVTWLGVPIDPPGTTGVRLIRLTNVRANAAQLGLSSTLIPTQIVGFVQVTGSQVLTINNPQQTLAYINQGLTSPSRVTAPTVVSLPHCQTHNSPLPSNPTPDFQINVTGPDSVFKRLSFLPNGNPAQSASQQNVPGYAYNTESSFYTPQAGAPSNFGTRFEAIFNNVPKGVTLFVPNVANSGGNQVTLTSDPNGPFAPVAGMNGWVQVPVDQGVGSVAYEVTGNAPTGPFSVNIPGVVSFTSNGLISGSPTPGPITFEISSQPVSPAPPNVDPAANPVPQFIDSFLNILNQGTENVDTGQIAVGALLSCSGTPPNLKFGFPFDTGNPMVFTVLPDGRGVTSQNAVVLSDTQALLNLAFQIRTSGSHGAGPTDSAAKSAGTELTASSGWLTATLPSTSTPLTATVQVNPTGMAPGNYSGSVTFSSSQAPSLTLPVQLVVMPSGPALASSAVFNAASYAPMAVAPGENILVYGSKFGPAKLTTAIRDAQGRLSTSLGGVQLLFDGILAPLVYTEQGVVSALVPFEVATKQITVMQVEYQGVKSASYFLPVVDAIPGLYTTNGAGGGQGAILNQNNSYNKAANPANPGDIIVLFGTGAGQTNPPGTDGNPAQAPYPKPLLGVSATIDGLPADVLYAGSVPGEPEGIFQINLRVPKGVTRGVGVPVLIKFGSKQTQPGVTVAISAAK